MNFNHLRITNNFGVYVDFTENLEPIYVGQGFQGRLLSFDRNQSHFSVIMDHGLIRVVVYETDTLQQALAKEKELTADLQTNMFRYPQNELACNRSDGGQGASGRPPPNKGVHGVFKRPIAATEKARQKQLARFDSIGRQIDLPRCHAKTLAFIVLLGGHRNDIANLLNVDHRHVRRALSEIGVKPWARERQKRETSERLKRFWIHTYPG